ncbi:MAG TPA: hypothetical protein RMH99_32330 [Sandaracinaceae bacterium LLY-WYZ-13_1]|nr:hypothetical protein [Sandaracinaceae bacterium LLY-WYZ-13_1]
MGRWLVVIGVLVVGCGVEARGGTGVQCDRNGECAAPLVCRLARCRRECRTSRDCLGDARCVADERGFGACQLPDETSCSLDSECPSPLVCRERRCVNECAVEGSARDCPPGAVCRAVEGGLGCVETVAEGCDADRECAPGFFCASDGRCRPQCVTDRDCFRDTACRAGRCVPAGDGGTGPDAGADGGVPRCPRPSDPIDLTAGAAHACVARADGTVACWGWDTHGQLGRGAPPPSIEPTPAPVAGLTGAVQVEAGEHFTCVRTDEPAVHCFGANGQGQLGAGSTEELSPTPLRVAGLEGALLDLGTGSRHACVARPTVEGILTSEARCWGDNVGDHFAPFAPDDVRSPVSTGMSFTYNPAALDGGDQHTCNLVDSPTGARIVECHGTDRAGALGADGFADGVLVDDARQVAAAGARGCLVRDGGTLYCWGENGDGQLGDGTTTDSPLRRRVPGLSAVDVAMSRTSTCAVADDCTVWCWGRNPNGALLGSGATSMTSSPTPVRVEGVSGAARVTLGDGFACALTSAGEVLCWGANLRGQLGRGASGAADPSPEPVDL